MLFKFAQFIPMTDRFSKPKKKKILKIMSPLENQKEGHVL